jgi:ADP-ribose pyrophosphatase
MARYHVRFKLFNGGLSNIVLREVMERTSAAAVLLYDPALDQVVLIEQFRPGAINQPRSPWLIEIIAGILETGETAENVAMREAQEEASCEILDLYPICEYFVSPGGSNEYIWLYCGRVDARKAGGIYGLKKENEDIRAFVLPVDEAFTMVREGKIKTAPAIISLQWIQLNREFLKNLWSIK